MPNPNDVRESFPTLEDSSTNAGVALTKSLEGDAAAGKVGQTAFVYKDSSGNLVLPQLDSQGRVPVSSEPQGTRLRAKGTAAGSLMSATGTVYSNMTVVLSIPAVANKNYGDMKGSVASRRGSLFQMIYQDTVNTVVLDESIVDAGQYTSPIGVDGDQFNVPASASSPTFQIRAGNFTVVSDLHSTLKVVQF